MKVKSIAEYSAIRSTFINLLFVIKMFAFLILSDRFTQVLLYIVFLIAYVQKPPIKDRTEL